jgi:hypothetical protein
VTKVDNVTKVINSKGKELDVEGIEGGDDFNAT